MSACRECVTKLVTWPQLTTRWQLGMTRVQAFRTRDGTSVGFSHQGWHENRLFVLGMTRVYRLFALGMALVQAYRTIGLAREQAFALGMVRVQAFHTRDVTSTGFGIELINIQPIDSIVSIFENRRKMKLTPPQSTVQALRISRLCTIGMARVLFSQLGMTRVQAFHTRDGKNKGFRTRDGSNTGFSHQG